ncbi:class I SAM-dependent methyltransferase [Actinoplanes bogorensis]|uniref:Class I SAM-dependent methyltransferase n=1 Tax=Paractinoplanes bogorensis TaxID=1610840 RepID=A0ABS5YRA6_9ACTN|nr:class I SAM-dependent methyltransferase [Actinoplanes bogorensis]MBU2665980.1 class I SAM-dependent methyltransferase [Actinoplanes bogorensis]
MRLTQRDLPEQLTFWNEWHRRRGASGQDESHREFRDLFLDRMTAGSDVFDIGCGQGHDLLAMRSAGHRVAGLDFSPLAVRRARRKVYGWSFSRRRRTHLRVHDIAARLPFESECFDGVYSHLALHYFHDDVTRQIFGEIARVLRRGGILAFSVKSTDDPYYGDGEQLGEHIFSRKGHVRHFFDDGYIKDLLDGWDLLSTSHQRGHYACTEPSAFIRAVARKAS